MAQLLENWSGREDLNLRPPAPHAGALPGCATPRIRHAGCRVKVDHINAIHLVLPSGE